MGLNKDYVRFIENHTNAILGSFQGKRMLELGNQRFPRSAGVKYKTGKEYFSRLGAEHISLDYNGKDGAIKLDLSLDLDVPEWKEYFDVITNCGTTEHVEPYESQFECFRNIHRWLKPGGIVIHINPAIEELKSAGKWKNHCNNYYSAEFYENFVKHNAYEIVESIVINDLRAACLKKTASQPFMEDRDEFLHCITYMSGGIVYPGINDKDVSLWTRITYRCRDILNNLRRIVTKH